MNNNNNSLSINARARVYNIPLTDPSCSLSAVCISIVVASTWLKSLKQCPVYPFPIFASSRTSLSPAAHNSVGLTTVSQSPDNSASVSPFARFLHVWRRSSAVPGYTTNDADALSPTSSLSSLISLVARQKRRTKVDR